MKLKLTSASKPNFVTLPWAPRVVVLGIPPYGVRPTQKIPKSLREFLVAYVTDLGFRVRSGDLRSWLEKFILMLDYDRLTFKVLSKISYEYKGVVFVLWGPKARKFSPIIDTTKHYLLTDEQGSFREAAEFLDEPPDFWRIY